jgi:hypothetical protein
LHWLQLAAHAVLQQTPSAQCSDAHSLSLEQVAAAAASPGAVVPVSGAAPSSEGSGPASDVPPSPPASSIVMDVTSGSAVIFVASASVVAWASLVVASGEVPEASAR